MEDAAVDCFLCPITHELMEDPVTCEDGHSYERASIEAHFRSWPDGAVCLSPKTGLPLRTLDLIPNMNLRNAIEEWKATHFRVARRADVEIGKLIAQGSSKQGCAQGHLASRRRTPRNTVSLLRSIVTGWRSVSS